MVRTVAEDESERRVIDDIAAYGWHCLHIHAEGELPPYSFTIGLFARYGHPELILFGLAAKTAHQILGIVADAAKAGAPIDLSRPTDALLNGYDCCFADVPRHHYRDYVGFCRWYYEGNDFPLVQVVRPSRDGQFPWHPDATAGFRALQPILAATPTV